MQKKDPPSDAARSKSKFFDFSRLVRFFKQSQIPLWLNLVIIVGTGIATYYLTPKINEKFESQKIRTAFAIETIKSLNTQTSDLLISVDALLEPNINPRLYKERYRIARDRGLALQWRVVETQIVFVGERDKTAVKELQVSVNNLLSSIPISYEIDQLQLAEVKKNSDVVGRQSAKVVSRVAIGAGVRSQ